MPFLGKDWRSSGEQWIRTEHGWERTRVLECILDNLNVGLSHEKMRKKLQKKASSSTGNKRLNSLHDDDSMDQETESILDEEDNDDGWNYVYDELSLLSDDGDDDDDDDEDAADEEHELNRNQLQRMQIDDEPGQSFQSSNPPRPGFLLRSRSVSQSLKRQPHIIYWDVDAANRENNAPKATISEVLNALDMPGAVKDIKRFNYVCRLVQIIINEKLNQLSGNAQRTLFMIVKHMLIQVIKTQENLNVMRKLLHDFKKKIQDSIYFYFYYIGSQKLCDRHLATISKWQEILDNPNQHRKLKRLQNCNKKAPLSSSSSSCADQSNKENFTPSSSTSFDVIPIDCKLEIIRRLNCGLDLVNMSKCNRNLNDLISNELKIWKNLCQFHFQQASINSFVTRIQKKDEAGDKVGSGNGQYAGEGDLDWKLIYFRLKRRYGHREVYVDMVHKCYHCKSLFWKEIGHPCVIKESLAYPDSLEIRSEPITPKRLMDLLLK